MGIQAGRKVTWMKNKLLLQEMHGDQSHSTEAFKTDQ